MKQQTLFGLPVLFLLSFLVLSGCRGGGTSSGAEVFVQYTLDPMICQNASSVIPYSPTMQCTWYCATYQGKKKQFVSLGFFEEYGRWSLTFESHKNATEAQCNFKGFSS